MTNFRNATGLILLRDASGDNLMKMLDMCVLNDNGVDNGMRSPPPGSRTQISEPYSLHSNRALSKCTDLVLEIRMINYNLSDSAFFIGALPSLGPVRMNMYGTSDTAPRSMGWELVSVPGFSLIFRTMASTSR